MSIDKAVILEQALESFRTTDYHFISPFVANQNSKVTLTIACRLVGAPPGLKPVPTTCRNALTFGGPQSTKTPKPAPKKP